MGRWRLEAPLGRGGMAEVWLARDVEQAHRRVVVKRMLRELWAQPHAIEMFRAEAELGAFLQHGRIVQLLDTGDDEMGNPYLVLEHVEGTDLRAALTTLAAKGRRLPPVVAVHVAREVLLALAHVHAITDDHGIPLGVVHRDVSPANILLSSAGEVKLCDFGVAKTLARNTSGRFLKGKVRYMSPEQVTGATVDARSDQFSVGAMLWETLTGQPRFQGDSLKDTLTNVIRGGLPEEAALDAPGGPLLLAILERALQPYPAQRFADAGEFAAALWQWLGAVGASDPVPALREIVGLCWRPAPVVPPIACDEEATVPNRIRVRRAD